jgi:hypothetical protein
MVEYTIYQRLSLPQRHIERIHEMSFIWLPEQPPSHDSLGYQHWVSFWDVITSFTGLKRLRVEIKVSPVWRYDWILHEARLLEVLKGVTQPEAFELVLPWPAGNQLPKLPCVISRVGTDDH